MKRIAIAALFFLVFFSSATYSAGTAEQLLAQCENLETQNYCLGYIIGFYDGRTTDDYGLSHLSSCPPTDESGENLKVTYTQMMRVFIQWANENTSSLHFQDWQAVRQAFAEAWPCE